MNVVYFDSAALTASGNSSGVIDLGNPATFSPQPPVFLSVLINETTVTGTTPSLTVEVQWSNDGTTFVSATTADTFTAITAAGTALKQFNIKARFARLKYTISGTTPSFTGTITGYAC